MRGPHPDHHHERHPERHRERHGGRHRRVFGQGGLRLVLLHLIAERPRHGYELIRAIEDRTGGAYVPSPGAIYPTLTLLEEMGHAIQAAGEGGRKSYAATEAGRAELAENAPLLEGLLHRLAPEEQEGRGHEGHREGRPPRPPQIALAIAHLRMALHGRLSRGPISEAEADAIAALIEDTARRLSGEAPPKTPNGTPHPQDPQPA